MLFCDTSVENGWPLECGKSCLQSFLYCKIYMLGIWLPYVGAHVSI